MKPLHITKRFCIPIVKISFLYFSLWACKSDGNDPFLFPESNSLTPIHIEYGNGLGNEISNKNLYPTFFVVDEKICWVSRPLPIRDYGPKLRICFHEENPNSMETARDFLTKVQSTLISPSETSSYPRFSLKWSDDLAKFDFLTELKLKSLWKKQPPKAYILGDIRIRKFLQESHSLKLRDSKYHLSYSYGVPYWNYYGGENECFFFFSTWDIDIPANQRRVLRMQFDCETIRHQISEFKDLVQNVNETESKNCQKENLELTEVFSHSNSKYGRFFEFQNPTNHTICSPKFLIERSRISEKNLDETLEDENDEYFEFSPNIDFVFPGAIVLFADTPSRLQAYDWVEGYKWSGLTRKSTGILHHSIEEESFPQTTSGFRFENDYLSFRKSPIPCSAETSPYNSKERFCGTPGIQSILQEFDDRESKSNSDSDTDPYSGFSKDRAVSSTENRKQYCHPRDFDITEINFWGLLDENGLLQKGDRFLEFQYNPKDGKTNCDLTSIILDIENQRIPLAVINDKTIESGTIFLVGISNQFPDASISIPRNLYLLNPKRSIHLEYWGNPEERAILYSPTLPNLKINIDYTIIPYDSKGNLYSIRLIDKSNSHRTFSHHPKMEYSFGNGGKKNYMSPGTLQSFGNQESLGLDKKSFYIQEVNWAGSYNQGVSITDDRFLEWNLLKDIQGSFFLELQTPNFPNRDQAYMIPLERGIHFLSKKPLSCFPERNGLSTSEFSLYTDPVVIRLLNEIGDVIDEVYLDTESYGKNDTSSRKRYSAIRIGNKKLWTTSSESHLTSNRFCQGETIASPGRDNFHLPIRILDGSIHSSNEFILPEEYQFLSSGNIQLRKIWGNQTESFSVNIHSNSLDHFPYIDLDWLSQNHSMGEGLIYYLWNDQFSGIFQNSQITLEAFQPNPNPPIYPWILICNHSQENWNWNQIILQTDSKESFLKTITPDTTLSLDECGLVVSGIDPDPDEKNLPSWISYNHIVSTQELNLISEDFNNRSNIDIFYWNGENRIHLASYGNRYMGESDTFSLGEGTWAKIRKSKMGGGREGYQKLNQPNSDH